MNLEDVNILNWEIYKGPFKNGMVLKNLWIKSDPENSPRVEGVQFVNCYFTPPTGHLAHTKERVHFPGGIKDCVFENCCFERGHNNTSFYESNVHNCIFIKCYMPRCDFRGANLTGTSFFGCTLTGASFSGSILDRCDFFGSSFYWTTMQWSNYLSNPSKEFPYDGLPPASSNGLKNMCIGTLKKAYSQSRHSKSNFFTAVKAANGIFITIGGGFVRPFDDFDWDPVFESDFFKEGITIPSYFEGKSLPKYLKLSRRID